MVDAELDWCLTQVLEEVQLAPEEGSASGGPIVRVRCDAGWTSVTSSSGNTLLVPEAQKPDGAGGGEAQPAAVDLEEEGQAEAAQSKDMDEDQQEHEEEEQQQEEEQEEEDEAAGPVSSVHKTRWVGRWSVPASSQDEQPQPQPQQQQDDEQEERQEEEQEAARPVRASRRLATKRRRRS